MRCHTIANSQVIPNTVYIPRIKEFTPYPQDATPMALFPPEVGYNSLETPCRRFRSIYDHEHILICTDGACLNNSGGDAAAGCAFYYRPNEEYETDKNDPGFISFRLEDTGPSGLVSLQTSNRAEIRAVIAALNHRAWCDEACTRITIATDSQYVVHGITSMRSLNYSAAKLSGYWVWFERKNYTCTARICVALHGSMGRYIRATHQKAMFIKRYDRHTVPCSPQDLLSKP
ncbi:hypothetical protein TWF751_002992 [Orbilia oligospora]|nr:hypothetical protein TWF751_002992 [Orbilia oligospora]